MPRLFVSRRSRLRTLLLGTAFTLAWGVLIAQSPPAPTKVLVGHTDPVYAVAISPEGTLAATGSFDKSIKLWDVRSGKELRTLAGKGGHTNQVLCVAFSPEGSLLASGGSDNTVKLWDVPTRTPVRSLDHGAIVTRVAATPDGKTYATAATDGTIKLWTAADGKTTATLKGHTGAVTGLAFGPNGQSFVSTGADHTLRYWGAKGEPLGVLGLWHGPATGLAVHPTNGTVYTTERGRLSSWPAKPAKIAVRPPLAAVPLAGTGLLAVTPNGAHVLTANPTAGVDVRNGQTLAVERTILTDGPVTAAAVSKDGQRIAIAHGAKPTITLVNFGDGKPLGAFPSGVKVTGLAFHPTSAVLNGTLADNRVVAWDIAFSPGPPPSTEFGQAIQEFPHPAPPATLAVTADAGLVLTTAGDQLARVWKVASDQPIKSLAHPNLVDAVAFDKTGTVLATAGHDGQLRLWDVTKGQVTKTIEAHSKPQPQPVYTVVWSPDGKKLATGCFDHTIKVWDATSGSLVKEIKGGKDTLPDPKEKSPPKPEPGHLDQVFTLAFSPDGRLLASGSSDRTVKLWDATAGTLIRDFPNATLPPPGPGLPIVSHPGFVHCVRFTPDGSRLISAGTAPRSQGYLAVWSVADGKLLYGQELHLGPIYTFDRTATEVLLGCGPKSRSDPASDAVFVPLPK